MCVGGYVCECFCVYVLVGTFMNAVCLCVCVCW